MGLSLRATTAVVGLLTLSPFLTPCHAQSMVFPGEDWQQVTPESQLVDSAQLAAAVSFLEANSPPGGRGVRELAIVRNGRMIWEGPRAGGAHDVRSVTKSITSTVLGLLIDDGLAELDTLAVDYMPSLAANYPDVTLRDLTTMTSGYRSAGAWVLNPFTPNAPHFTPPGAMFHYSNSAMEVLSNVLTQIAAEPIEDLFRRRIADPIGMDGTQWRWPHRAAPVQPDGLPINYGAGKFVMSAENAARLGHLFLNRGQWNGQQLIDAEWVDQATRVQVPMALPLDPNADVGIGPGTYGYNWWINGVNPDTSTYLPGSRLLPGAPIGTYWAWGVNNNLVFVVPEWDMVVVRQGTGEMSQTTPAIPTIPSTTWGEFFGQIGDALLPNAAPLTLALPPDQIYTVIDDDVDSPLDDLGDDASDRGLKPRGSLGEADLLSGNKMLRLVAKFTLPGLPDGTRRLESATLRFFLEDIEGTPPGPVSLLHSLADDDLEPLPSDYEDASYMDTLLDLVRPTDLAQIYYELDVTDLVLADYAHDGSDPRSAFRLQINDAIFIEDDQSHRYRFTMPGGEANHPELVLTFVPEPSTFALAGLLGLVGLLQSTSQRQNATMYGGEGALGTCRYWGT